LGGGIKIIWHSSICLKNVKVILQVISVKKRHPSVQKISFVGHSLGGLIARYAIARLYERDITKEISHETGNCKSDESEDKDNCVQEKSRGTIAGLEPMNFITSATPHLGSRFHKQVIRLFFIDAFTVKSLV
jgi:triacylglycerol esterase/lipase EstA (alpha/beta hydrolase family)